jgi:hypothetical protein
MDDIEGLTAKQIEQKTQYMKEQIAKEKALEEYKKVKKQYDLMKSSKEYNNTYRSEYD